MMANMIATATGTLDWGFAGALITMLFVTSLLALALMQYVFGGVGLIANEGGGTGLRAMRTPGGREGRIVWALDSVLDPVWPYQLFPVVAGAVFVFLIVPIVMIVPLSFSSATFFVFPPPGYSLRSYANYLSAPGWLRLDMAQRRDCADDRDLLGHGDSGRARPVALFLACRQLLLPAALVAPHHAEHRRRRGCILRSDRSRPQLHDLGVALGHTIISLPIAVLVLVAALRNSIAISSAPRSASAQAHSRRRCASRSRC